jgi:hypothetical protein
MTIIEAMLVVSAWLAPLPTVRASGSATVYYPGDGHSGSQLGCVAAARRIYGTAEFRAGTPVIAMRPGNRPPCGTRVVVEHRDRRAAAVMLDSGPYGADCPEGRRVVATLPRECQWRGVADLSVPVARAVGLRGRGKVKIRW